MAEVNVLDVLLYGEPVGTLTRVQGDRTLFAFNEAYIANEDRPTLSLSFKDSLGDLITDIPRVQTRVPPFFANMLPEGTMRDYLAERAGVNPKREFFLLWALGADLPGAVMVQPAEGEAWPPDHGDDRDEKDAEERRANALRFSLAGVQLKFSAVMNARGGLTIPADGVGGSWIIKLPSTSFARVPENEHAMMSLAGMVGIDVPEIHLTDPAAVAGLPERVDELEGQALAVKRFDRTAEGGRVHIEDFAQVFGVFPDDKGKYGRASYRNIAEVLAAETSQDEVAEFIRRMVFSTLIGNADMHVKNVSLMYPDRRHAMLAPAYDLVSTIAYMRDDEAGLKFARTKKMHRLTRDELAYLAAKARLPEKLVLDTAKETVGRFHAAWAEEKTHLGLTDKAIRTIDEHISDLPIAMLGAERVS